MPKILINEKDRTSPGTPNSYGNFSVLIPGFASHKPVTPEDVINDQTKKVDPVQPDSNGVYEFDSVQDFIDCIGEVPPNITAVKDVTPEGGTTTKYEDEFSISHYGNQMAYELLSLGYQVIFKPLAVLEFVQATDTDGKLKTDNSGKPVYTNTTTKGETLKNALAELENENFWEIFKDKASYDFRFVTHGLLESSELSSTEQAELAEILSEQQNLKADKSMLNLIANRCGKDPDSAEYANYVNIAYQVLIGVEPEPAEVEDTLGADFINELKSSGSDRFKKFEQTETDGELSNLYTYGNTYFDAVESLNESIIANDVNINTLTAKRVINTSLINKVNGCIANLAKYTAAGTGNNTYNDMDSRDIPGRGDCIALIELDEDSYLNIASYDKPETQIAEAIANLTQVNADNGKYCALTVPSVYYKMAENEKFKSNKKFPAAFHYLACFMYSLNKGFAEWYAAAGYNRGVSSYIIDHTSVKLGEIAINALEPRNIQSANDPKFACNVIANFRGSYYLWGNRTAHPLDDAKGGGNLVASHFLNIRQLCTTIKKQLYVSCRRFTFDPNSDTLWINFCNAIKPTLEAMKADQGIRDYKIVKVFTDKKATLKAKIRIIPIEAVEDFDLEVSLEDSFGETAAVVTE